MKLRISKIEEAAKTRPEGYLENVLSRGVVGGEWLEISEEELAKLRLKYRPAAAPYPPEIEAERSGFQGLGDVVHAVAHPVATVLDWATGSNLSSCGACAKRREELNRAVPFK